MILKKAIVVNQVNRTITHTKMSIIIKCKVVRSVIKCCRSEKIMVTDYDCKVDNSK